MPKWDDIAEKAGISPQTLSSRLLGLGWPIEKAMDPKLRTNRYG